MGIRKFRYQKIHIQKGFIMLLGYFAKAKKESGWQSKTTFVDLMKEMIKEDLTVVIRDQF
jgi:GDP-D-mannose dehydratase